MKYELWQVQVEHARLEGFMSWEMRKKMIGDTIDLSHYDVVYSGEVPGDGIEACERLFERFNINHPRDYTGRSMSTGDIVKGDGVYYYCDDIGFVDVTDKIGLK